LTVQKTLPVGARDAKFYARGKIYEL